MFIKNVNECKIEAGVLQNNITDHFSTIQSIENKNKETITKNSIKIINYTKLNEFFKNEKLAQIFICNDVNKRVNIFLDKIIQFVKLSVRIENSKNKRLKEWFTAG